MISLGNPDQRTGDVVYRQALDGLLFDKPAAEDLLSQPSFAARCRHEIGLSGYHKSISSQLQGQIPRW